MLSNRNCRIALGTVQFGLPYGVANKAGQVALEDAAGILNLAETSGLDTLDTAIAYGESEKRLGQVGVDQWQVISKLPAVPDNQIDVAAWVQESVMGSLERLKISKLSGLLLHRPEQLNGVHGKALYLAMNKLKEQGRVEKIGVSIYDPTELISLIPHFKFDLVQSPFNVFDRRLLTSGWLKRLNSAGVEVHVRSIFLQGLLLMGKVNRPPAFARWQSLWSQWHCWLDESAMSPLAACLGFVMGQPEINRVVLGVDSETQLREIIDCVEKGFVRPPVTLSSEDKDLINPTRWGQL